MILHPMMGERSWPIEALFVFVLLSAVGLHAAAPIACTDFFWHLKLGQIIASTGAIPSTDMFSAVHPESAYVQPQWLWEWLAALVYEASGFPGIRAMQAIVLVSSFAGLYGIVRALTGRGSAAALVSVLALMLFEDRFRARPDALTLGFVVLSLPILAGMLQHKRTRLVYTFGLMVLWANMHGGASVLFLLSLFALSAGSVIDRLSGLTKDPADMRAQLLLLLVAGVGFLCSPTLLRGLAHWISLIGPQIQTGNEEWMPTYTALAQGVNPCTVLIATAPSMVLIAYAWEQIRWTRAHGRIPGALGEQFLCAGYLILSQHAIRNVFLCIVPVIFMLVRRAGAGSRWLTPGLVAATLLVGVITVEDVVTRTYGGISSGRALYAYDLVPDTYPEEAGQFIAEAGIEGGILNHGPWGGYLIFRNWPKAHIFVDTRQNMTADMWRVFMATLTIPTRAAALDEAFARWGVELILLRGPTFPLGIAPSHWQLLYKAGDQELYQHRNGRHARDNHARAADWLGRHGMGANEDFTAAATRIGAATWLATPFQKKTLDQVLRSTRSTDTQTRAAAFVRLGEIYYRAGLLTSALKALKEAERLGPLSARTVYLDAFCSFATGDHVRARAKVNALRSLDLSSLSRRHMERLVMLDRALSSPR